jgi:hypothetical protein
VMKRIFGLALVVSLFLPLSLAHSAEVTQLYTNNLFAVATSNDDATQTSIQVVVTREKGKGAFVDTIAVSISGPSGFSFIQGTLPKNALQITAKKASLDVDLSEIAVTGSQDFPAQGIVTVDWTATDVTRTSGNTKFQSGNQSVNIVGTSTFADAVVSGSVVGTELVDPFGFLNVAHDSVIIHLSNE